MLGLFEVGEKCIAIEGGEIKSSSKGKEVPDFSMLLKKSNMVFSRIWHRQVAAHEASLPVVLGWTDGFQRHGGGNCDWLCLRASFPDQRTE